MQQIIIELIKIVRVCTQARTYVRVPHSSLSGRALTEQQQGEAGRGHAVPTEDMRPASQSVLRGEGRTHQDPELTDMSPGQVGPDSCKAESNPPEGERRQNQGPRQCQPSGDVLIPPRKLWRVDILVASCSYKFLCGSVLCRRRREKCLPL